MFTDKLGVKHKIQNRNAQANHRHIHWVSKLNHIRSYYLVNIRNFVEEAICDTQSLSYNLPWSVFIYAVVLDDKFGIPIGSKVALSVIQHESSFAVVKDRDETFAGDHDFKRDKVVASVIN